MKGTIVVNPSARARAVATTTGVWMCAGAMAKPKAWSFRTIPARDRLVVLVRKRKGMPRSCRAATAATAPGTGAPPE